MTREKSMVTVKGDEKTRGEQRERRERDNECGGVYLINLAILFNMTEYLC